MRRKLATMGRKTTLSNPQIILQFNSLIVLFYLLSSVYSQSIELNNQTPPIDDTNSTNLLVNATTTTGELLLLGVNDFVDYTESPTILVDNLFDSQNSSQIQDRNKTDESSLINNQLTNFSSLSHLITSTSLPNLQPTTSKPALVTTIQPVTTAKSTQAKSQDETTSEAPEKSGYEEEEDTNGGDGESTSSEEETSSGTPFEPPKNVTEYMDYIESLFHDFRHQLRDLFEPHIPQLIRSSQMVQLSGSCSFDMLRMVLGLRQFEPWALRMIDSSGKIPEGIFEGSFTALGSYDECLATVFSPSSSSQTGASTQQEPQPEATQGKYCLVNVSPFLPPKPPTDRVERLFQEEANRRNYTKDNHFSRLSPVFYYMKFRIGVCIPSTCLNSDMDSISSALSSSLRLNITIPHCRVKQAQPITNQQLVAGSIFGFVLALVVGATMVDLWAKKLNQMSRKEKRLLMETSQQAASNSVFIALGIGTNKLANHCQQVNTCISALDKSIRKPAEQRLAARLANNWSWLSFSLLTNFKLYFSNKSSTFSQAQLSSSSSWNHSALHNCQQQSSIIQCLDGIRVISLCWVILANSYVTLDPRATKLLSETRKAPKDFLFQFVVQASLAIETFFFLSGLLMSLSFANRLRPTLDEGKGGLSRALKWIQFYVHRYIRMTPATMLVIAFSMFAFRFGDGPLWLEATHKAHQSCRQNWWRHLLHLANFVDTRQMCFIHYWYIAADMQLFLVAPVLMFLLYHRRRWIGYGAVLVLSFLSIIFLFYNTYLRNLPPTLLFYNSDPESRREYGNTIMTKPLTHAMPYMVGMLLGKWLSSTLVVSTSQSQQPKVKSASTRFLNSLFGLVATTVALAEVFLPYKWNNSHLPTRLIGALYASLFRFCWSLVLAYLVLSCRHKVDKRCRRARLMEYSLNSQAHRDKEHDITRRQDPMMADPCGTQQLECSKLASRCMCGSGGSLLNRFLSLPVFTYLSKLSFVAYLIHLPLMSVFVSQTRGLFAFSHTLVLHLALSYLVMAFILSFILVHLIEFPFITFERYLFERLLNKFTKQPERDSTEQQSHNFEQVSSRKLETTISDQDMRHKRQKC